MISLSTEIAPVKNVQLEGKFITITETEIHKPTSHSIPQHPSNQPLQTSAPQAKEFDAFSAQYPNKLFALQADVTQEALIQTAIDAILKDAGALHDMRVPSAPYGASKAGVRNMTYTLAMEWAQLSNSLTGSRSSIYGGMPRLAAVEELGGAYVYLLSDAASYTTSFDILVNGVIGIC
ncbi:conserved hypothetical protein [Pyrenophora tritici-repentis Pt-1C-BFP]|uniref:Uncharacterized protein n=1 Tax=Pyrenophora tritici-repentis (strain Pt-1C-BFP) TaxID=426418 RepID=B2VRV8_PYRTR|nr:uncharacterized protein PTRG_00310 [Pyrenophora tritici-repentis Pt-1C-BFP]EDU39748.1 conserved hypothetical protein [Pyrenophora tritici-repentis Pt-1C-BFP]